MEDNTADQIPEPKERKMNRREAISWFVGAVCVLPTAFAGAFMVFRYLLPKVVLQEKRFRLAKTSEITSEGLEARVKGTSFIVIQQDDKIRAFSTVCTHLGCKVQWKPDLPGFYCPCHDGYFDADGKVTKGPPPLPLPEYPIEVEGEDVYIRLIFS